MATEIVLDALLMAVWRRKPKQSVIIHSDQGSRMAVMTLLGGAKITI